VELRNSASKQSSPRLLLFTLQKGSQDLLSYTTRRGATAFRLTDAETNLDLEVLKKWLQSLSQTPVG
jgi:hypothetical protein